MTHRRLNRTTAFFSRCLIALVLLAALTLQAQGNDAPWLKKPFRYEARNDNIADVLIEFCAAQGVTAVVGHRVTGTISGDFDYDRPADFLDDIARNNRLTWYYDGHSVYFYSQDAIESAVVQFRWFTPERLKHTLMAMGLYDARFQWTPLDYERMLFFTGPPRYIEMVKTLVRQLEESASSDMTMRVFRLNHAWADDITLEFMDKKVVIPGLASLLRSITGGESQKTFGTTSTGGNLGVLEQKRRDKATASTAEDTFGSSRIMADPARNAVLVWDVRERMPYYEQAIEQLDIPVGLVEIRAAIINVSTNRLDELGINWNAAMRVNPNDKTTRQSVGVVGGANVGTGDDAVNFYSNQGGGLNLTTIYTHGIDQLMMRVSALESDGGANVLSRPTVMTLDNVQAMLQMTNTFFVKLEGQEEVDLHNVTYGTMMKVTPHIINTPDGQQVKLIVNIEDGAENPTATGADDIPVVSKSTINTQAIVSDSQALIIGGHYYETHSASDSGIPGAKNIPVMGTLFGTTSNKVQKTERLFIIAPTVVDIKDIARQQERIKRDTFTRTLIEEDGSMPPPARPSGGCSRQAPTPKN